MTRIGYYRYPTIAGDRLVFVTEGALWRWERGDRVAMRLTSGVGEVNAPRLSPDGKTIAFVGREEGQPELFTIDADGGLPERRTFLGGETCLLSGWSRDGAEMLIASDAQRAFSGDAVGYAVPLAGSEPRALEWGPLRSIAYGRSGTVIGRNADDPARWKRYRGGTAGELWIDADGSGSFHPLITLAGNLVAPMWIGDRVAFLSDHEGIGQIYSCTVTGDDLRCHTRESEYYVRFPASDGCRIVYTAGGDIRLLDLSADTLETLAVEAPAHGTERRRRFVAGAELLEEALPSPDGAHVALLSRGQAFTMPLWEDAVERCAGESGHRVRCLSWLHDGKRLAYVSDATGFERIEMRALEGDVVAVTHQSLGRFRELVASPVEDLLAFTTHRHELGVVDIASGTVRMLDRSLAARLGDLAFSPDGRYIAYAIAAVPPPALPNPDSSIIRIVEIATGALHDITAPLRTDRTPAWDPEGRYVAFLAARDFAPVYDALQFELSFPQAMRPFLVTLQRETASPFLPKPASLSKESKDDHESSAEKGETSFSDAAVDGVEEAKEGERESQSDEERDAIKPIVIDFDGIGGRILGFPIEEGDYGQLVAVKGRVLFTKFPVRGISPGPRSWDHEERGGELIAYDFVTQRSATIATGIEEIVLGPDRQTLLYRSEGRLRVIDAATELPDDAPSSPDDEPGRKSGWLDLDRLRVEILPEREWAQMYHEAWRLQREHFWAEDMSRVDWERVRDRYARLLPRLRTRAELSDLVWEMQGELGTSHAYEIGGDYRKPPNYRRGFLGATWRYDSERNGYTITEILRGDSWDRTIDSPLAAPGVDVRVGDTIVAVGDRRLDANTSLDAALVDLAGCAIVLTIQREHQRHRVIVRTLKSERGLRYRVWVEQNRRNVHERSGGRIGYVHIPDMGPWGFAEFHRGYLAEYNRGALIVDARHNRGGHISPLILEKLARRRVGYDISRYGPPLPYPPESVAGPMVALTDQWAGSDGDIFSHCFKLYGLGPLIGKRTWGGVIGIQPTHELVDGTVTTQPEYAFWFRDVGWGVENYGTDPDEVVEITPQDARAGRDPQLDRAIAIAEAALVHALPEPPIFTPRPNLALP